MRWRKSLARHAVATPERSSRGRHRARVDRRVVSLTPVLTFGESSPAASRRSRAPCLTKPQWACLLGLVVVLLVLSAFFSATETALMSLNRYRLRHQARAGNRAARVAERLLQRPDRLIGVILLGNTGTNIAAAALVTFIALRVGGERAIFASTLALTVIVLIFAEVAPKTLAALNPPRYALPSAPIYFVLLKIVVPDRMGLQPVHERAAPAARRGPGQDLVALAERRRAAHDRRRGRRDGAAPSPADAAQHPRLGRDSSRRRDGAATGGDRARPRPRLARQPRRSFRRASTIGCRSIAATSTTSSASLACATCCPSSCAASSRRRSCSSASASRISSRKALRSTSNC